MYKILVNVYIRLMIVNARTHFDFVGISGEGRDVFKNSLTPLLLRSIHLEFLSAKTPIESSNICVCVHMCFLLVDREIRNFSVAFAQVLFSIKHQ